MVAPHPDDETLGAAGTLLRRKHEGGEVAWLIVTSVSESAGFSEERVASRAQEIREVSERFAFDHVFELGFPTAQLDAIPMSDLVGKVSEVFREFQPEEVFLPHPADIHTDHRVVFDMVSSCTKSFRYPSVKRVLAYETLSETDFALGTDLCFTPNVFVDVSAYIEQKIEIMKIYESEMGEFPFPRSEKAVRALASLRGAASGFEAAEGFQLLRERL